MNIEQMEAFIKNVKGRKIIGDWWKQIHIDYVIPTGEFNPQTGLFTVDIYFNNTFIERKNDYVIDLNVGEWLFYEGQETTLLETKLSETKCTCSSRNLFHFGCKCGAFEKERNAS